MIGPNGAGKTTLLNVISATLPLDEGEVRIGESRIDSTSPRHCALAGIARTFQNIRLFGGLTVRQNVEVSFTTSQAHRPREIANLSVDSIIDQLGLRDDDFRKARELPYGQ